MTHLLNLIGTLQNCINDFILFGIFAVILSKPGIGHKTLLRLGMIYCGWRGLNALSIGLDLHYGVFSLRSATFREIAACLGSACVCYFGVAVADVIRTLVTSETNTQARTRITEFLEDEQTKKLDSTARQSKAQNEYLRVFNEGGAT